MSNPIPLPTGAVVEIEPPLPNIGLAPPQSTTVAMQPPPLPGVVLAPPAIPQIIAPAPAPTTLPVMPVIGPLGPPGPAGPQGPPGTVARVAATISTTTTAANAADTDYLYICTAALTLTLPPAATTNTYRVVNQSSSPITIAAQSGQSIEGAPTLVMRYRNSAAVLSSDGTNWWIT